MNKLSRYLLFLASLLCVVFLIGCKNDAFSEHALVEVSFAEDAEDTNDGSRSLVPDSYGRGNVRLVRNYEPNALFWLYTAEHKYDVSTGHQSSVYVTGESPRDASGNLIKQPVSDNGEKGFTGYRKIMSAGDWEITLYGYDATNQAGCTNDKIIYKSEVRTVTVKYETSLQKIGFKLNFVGTGDYAKRYLFVPAFDTTVNDRNVRYNGITEAGYIRCCLFWIKNDLSGTYSTNDEQGIMIATEQSTYNGAIGKAFHFNDISGGPRPIADEYLDCNECLHFFAGINYRPASGGYTPLDMSEFVTVPTRKGYTTYVDAKMFKFGAGKKGGGTVFYRDNAANSCCYRFFKWFLSEINPTTLDTEITVGTDISDYWYICTDYPQSSGSGAGTTAPHKDKYYVWNKSLVAGDMSYVTSDPSVRNDSAVASRTDSGTEWVDYTIGGVTYKFGDRESCTSSTMGTGRSRTEYWINVYRRDITTSGSKYEKKVWEAPGCIAPYIRNLRASKAKGCDDWYIPSQGELKMLLSDSTRRTEIAKYCRDMDWGDSGKQCVISSSVCASASSGSACRFNGYVDVGSTAYTHSSSGVNYWYNMGVTPIRSF